MVEYGSRTVVDCDSSLLDLYILLMKFFFFFGGDLAACCSNGQGI